MSVSGSILASEFFWPSSRVCFTLRTHEAIPSHLRSGHARGFFAHRPVHGSLPRTPEKPGRWSTDALSHAPHLHPVLGIAASRHRHVLSLSTRRETPAVADHWQLAGNNRFRVVYHSVLLRATSHTLV